MDPQKPNYAAKYAGRYVVEFHHRYYGGWQAIGAFDTYEEATSAMVTVSEFIDHSGEVDSKHADEVRWRDRYRKSDWDVDMGRTEDDFCYIEDEWEAFRHWQEGQGRSENCRKEKFYPTAEAIYPSLDLSAA